MKKHKMVLKEEIVKYLFPRAEPEVIISEDGYLAYDFRNIYPSRLAISLPVEIEHSSYSDVFPKPFEEYFLNIHEDIDYLSRLLEVRIVPNIKRRVKAECVFGKVLERSENDHIIFRFDELIDSNEKTDLLCRVRNPGNSITTDDKMDILAMDPYFTEMAKDYDGTQFLYFIVPVGKMIEVNDQIIASLFAYAHSLRNG